MPNLRRSVYVNTFDRRFWIAAWLGWLYNPGLSFTTAISAVAILSTKGSTALTEGCTSIGYNSCENVTGPSTNRMHLDVPTVLSTCQMSTSRLQGLKDVKLARNFHGHRYVKPPKGPQKQTKMCEYPRVMLI